MNNTGKDMKPNWILITIIGILSIIIGCLLRVNQTTDNQDIIKKYESQIDSLKRINCVYIYHTDSLNTVINKNDSVIRYMAIHIDWLQQNRKIIEKKYDDENKKLTEMSNDSIVIYIRDYLRLWGE
jgi:ABC-type antimicrobial peptide transport system permease subunit